MAGFCTSGWHHSTHAASTLTSTAARHGYPCTCPYAFARRWCIVRIVGFSLLHFATIGSRKSTPISLATSTSAITVICSALRTHTRQVATMDERFERDVRQKKRCIPIPNYLTFYSLLLPFLLCVQIMLHAQREMYISTSNSQCSARLGSRLTSNRQSH